MKRTCPSRACWATSRRLPGAGATQERSVSDVLDTLELGVAAIASGNARGANLALMETDARNAARRPKRPATVIGPKLCCAAWIVWPAGRAQRPPRRRSRRTDRSAWSRSRNSCRRCSAHPRRRLVRCLADRLIFPARWRPRVPRPHRSTAPYAPPGPRHYLNLDALGFWVKHDSLPALVTTSPAGTPQDEAGVLRPPGTSVLFGNQNSTAQHPSRRSRDGRDLARQSADVCPGRKLLDAGHGVDELFRLDRVFSGTARRGQILARPFFDSDPTINAQVALLVAFPNANIAGVLVNSMVRYGQRDQQLQSAGAGGRWGLGQYTSPGRMFIVGGYRFFQLNESLSIISRSSRRPAAVSRSAEHHGLRLLLDQQQLQRRRHRPGGRVSFAATILVRRRRPAGDGQHARDPEDRRRDHGRGLGFTATLPNGLLAQPTNIGSFTQNHFALIPSVDLKVGYHLTPGFRLTVGYNFTYVTRVLRPVAQVDTKVNTSQVAGQPLVGPANPSVLFNQGSLWLQGVTAGFDLAF